METGVHGRDPSFDAGELSPEAALRMLIDLEDGGSVDRPMTWNANKARWQKTIGKFSVNVGIPVPLGIFGFTGHKDSFFGDLHIMGMDGIRFFTEQKSVTAHWFTDEAPDCKVDTWDGMINMPEDK